MAEPETISRAVAAFGSRFGGQPDVVIQAPGRVNLIGEHTDYNEGFVLPMAIDCGTVVVARRAGQDVRIAAADLDEDDLFSATEPVGSLRPPDWRNYPRGVIALLADAGIMAGGIEMVIAGDVPRGAGLSSSASLEVAVGLAVSNLAGHDLDRTALARIAQRAENLFAQCACGIMDQLISARAEQGHALLIDCRNLAYTSVPIRNDLTFLVFHSGIERGLVDSAYNERRRQCEQAAAFFCARSLRDVTVAEVTQTPGLDPLLRRRALHVVTENARTLAAARALSIGDLASLAILMAQSQASMRDNFEITLPPIDSFVEILRSEIGLAGGARMTGGGFGGCVIAIVRENSAPTVIDQALNKAASLGLPAELILQCKPAGGAHQIR